MHNASVGSSSKRNHDDAFNPSVYPRAGPATAYKKKKKNSANDDEAEPETRVKRYRASLPVSLTERVQRVHQQRFYCVSRRRTGRYSETFQVLGSIGNVYTVNICNVPTCSCPDKNATCKHILFVMLKILRIPEENNLWYQQALLDSELAAIFAHARPVQSTTADERAKQGYRIAIGEETPGPSGSTSLGPQKRVPQVGDSCPICYEDFDAGQEDGLVFCLSLNGCGNPLHRDCFAQWAKQTNPVTCVSCRTEWKATATSSNGVGGPSYSEGYLNLADQLGISKERDTSTYYRGPQRGRRWGRGRGRYEEYGWEGDEEYDWEDEDPVDWLNRVYGRAEDYE